MGLFDIVDDFISDPVGTTVNTVTQPLRDAVIVFNGLTEGELRAHAAARLGADYVAGLALSELIDLYE